MITPTFPQISKIKQYILTMEQVGTSIPTINTYFNTLGEITMSRTGVGDYNIESNELFTVNKTIVIPWGDGETNAKYVTNAGSGVITCATRIRPIDENIINIRCFTSLNGTTAREFSDVGGTLLIIIYVFKN